MGLKLWTGGLLSGVDAAAGVGVVVTEKMGLNPEASRGLVLLSEAKLLAGEGAAAETRLEAEEAAAMLIRLLSPNRVGPATAATLTEGLET